MNKKSVQQKAILTSISIAQVAGAYMNRLQQMYARVTILLALWCVLGMSLEETSWVMSAPSSGWPTLKVTVDEGKKKLFSSTMEEELLLVSGESDGEAVDAFEHYFWHMEDGVVLELGALDGTRETTSQSLVFEKFGWKRVLVEANPVHREGLRKQTKAFAASAAICSDEANIVHYSLPNDPKNFMTGGIVEFMAPSFVQKYHGEIFRCSSGGVFNASSIDWSCPAQKLLTVTPVSCLPLTKVLNTAKVNHINVFILDVEGAEISILSGIDFTQITFDIIVVERTHWRKLIHFFSNSDYTLVADRGRNYWYKHKNFVPRERPEVASKCFRGCVKSHVSGSKWAMCTETSLPIP